MIGSQYFFMIRTPYAMISPAHEKRALRSLSGEPRSFRAPDLLNKTRADDAPEKEAPPNTGRRFFISCRRKNSVISQAFLLVSL